MPKQRGESASRTKRRKRWLSLLIVVIISLTLMFLLELTVRRRKMAPELTLRYGDHIVPHPVLPYHPRPNDTHRVTIGNGEFTCFHRFNSLGFRDVEHETTKPEGVYRIVGLGDSFTYGAGVEYEDTYLAVLERLLNAREGEHKKVEIIKLGIPGYYPETERLVLEEFGLQFSPDLVVIGFVGNDVYETYVGLDAVKICPHGFLMAREAKMISPLGEWVYLHSHVGRLVLSRYIQYRLKQIPEFKHDKVNMDNGPHESEWRQIEQEYTKISSLIQEQNAKLLVFQIPQRGPWHDIDYYPMRRIYPVVQENGGHSLDLFPAMIERAKVEKLYWDIDSHCTAAGYRVIAEQLFQAIQDNGWAQ